MALLSTLNCGLPPELTDFIIDILGAEWRNSVKNKPARDALINCMHASREFCIRARKHLFRRVATDIGKITPSDLELFNNAPPGMALPISFVRKIRVTFTFMSQGSELSQEEFEEQEDNINLRLSHFESLLEKVAPRLESFWFEVDKYDYLPSANRRFIQMVCSSTSITSLTFCAMVDFPMDAVSHCVNLTKLLLLNVFPKRSTSWCADAFCKLETFHMDCKGLSVPIFPPEAFENKRAFTKVKDLRFCLFPTMNGPLAVFEILHRSKNILQTLSINTYPLQRNETDEELDTRGTVNISDLPNLRSLTVATIVKRNDPFTKRFRSMFLERALPNKISTLTFYIQFDFSVSQYPWHPIPLEGDWTTLDELLSDRSIYRRLQYFDADFTIHVFQRSDDFLRGDDGMYNYSGETQDFLDDFASAIFPKVKERPAVAFRCKTDIRHPKFYY
ncbi:hypothetical protein NLJ89_g7543 [Agrocybe chaxingu]|uniref:Uncharacterized protein n=1 Tax=Agrocybe chaxingu TaxID=84603 RepID=A0A9W8JWL4_9AGAR|nr:hypothetical protein NLJ89_g7543 [Agrocybe chaxingu]